LKKLKEELKQIKSEKKSIKEIDKKTEKNIKKISKNYCKMKHSAKIFNVLLAYHEQKKQKKRYDYMIRDTYFRKRKLFLVFNSWRNVANSAIKIRIKSKYSKYYNEKYSEIKQKSNNEISRLQNILENLHLDIQSEITQRESLSKMYDISINKGVDVFIKETNNIIEFDASSIFLFYFILFFNFFIFLF